MTPREFAIAVTEQLQEAGFQALWAGGCVRDEMLGLVPKDYDVATDATPEQVQRVFRKTVPIGAAFGVIQVLGPKTDAGWLTIEVATFRTDGAYSDGRRPDGVVFASPREDALRRDFTINGMFFDPVRNEHFDYVGGRADLEAKVLRAIGDPQRRIEEDKLRMLRAVRLATRFGLTIDAGSMDAIRLRAADIRVVSAERIADEMRKILMHSSRAAGMRLLRDLGLLIAILPEALHLGDLRTLALAVLDQLQEPTFPLALAVLLHSVGVESAEQVALRWKLSNAERERVVWLVVNHQILAHAKTMRLSQLKTILAHPGVDELLELHRADAMAGGRDVEHVEHCRGLLSVWTSADLDPLPLLTGHDLIRAGFKPGPRFKAMLDALREGQLEGTIRTAPEAWELIHRLK